MKTFKVRHPVYNMYRKGELVMRLHVIYGRLLPERFLNLNTWISGLSSGEIKLGDNKISNFYPDDKSAVESWVKHYDADRIVKVIHEMEYKGYAK